MGKKTNVVVVEGPQTASAIANAMPSAIVIDASQGAVDGEPLQDGEPITIGFDPAADDVGGTQVTHVYVDETTDMDTSQLTELVGPPIYEREWNMCLSLAFHGTGRDMLTDWGNVPFELATFMRNNIDAPEEAAVIHVKRAIGVAVLPNEDPDRVKLALMLFRNFIVGQDIIEREAATKQRLADEAAHNAANALRRSDTEGGAFEVEQGGLAAPSDLAKLQG
jgi:hypothetical protein